MTDNNLAGRDIPGCNEETAASGLEEDGVGEAGVQARPRVLHLALVRAVEQPAALPATHCARTGGRADDTPLGGLGGGHAADQEEEGEEGGVVDGKGWREERRASWRPARDSRAGESETFLAEQRRTLLSVR